MINNFERDMSEALDAMRREKETATQDIEKLNDQVWTSHYLSWTHSQKYSTRLAVFIMCKDVQWTFFPSWLTKPVVNYT